MSEQQEEEGDQGAAGHPKSGVKKVSRDVSAEDERDHFRKQLVRRPWTH